MTRNKMDNMWQTTSSAKQPQPQQQQQQQQQPQPLPNPTSTFTEQMVAFQDLFAQRMDAIQRQLEASNQNLQDTPLQQTSSAFPLRPAPTSKTSEALGPLSIESQCFEIAQISRGEDAIWRHNGVCQKCAQHLTVAQRAVVEVDMLSYSGSAADAGCCICDIKSGKPEYFTKPFCQFLTENPTIFHAVDYFKVKLSAAGFTEVCHCFDRSNFGTVN